MCSECMTTQTFAVLITNFLFCVEHKYHWKIYDMMFALTIEPVYLVMMMMVVKIMIQVLFQHVVWKLHMM